MAIMKDIRSFFHRKKPVVIDLRGTQAEGLGEAARQVANGDTDPPTQIDERAIDWKAMKARSAADQRGDAGSEEVVTLIESINESLQARNDRSEQLLPLMERLPQAIDALPDIIRENSSLLEAITEHIDHPMTRDS